MELSIQERLKDRRVERGLTLEQLAEETHLSKSALGSYEGDDLKDISHYALIKLAKFYEVSIDHLLCRSHTKNHPNADLADLCLSDDIKAEIFTPSTKQRLDELEETKSQLEVSILHEEMHKPLLTREQIASFIYRFRKFDVTKREQQQRLIDSFVNAVYLYEDKIILTFNYKDGSKTITLAEVEGSDLSAFGASTFLQKSERTHFVAPPFQTGPAALGSGLGPPCGRLFLSLAEISLLTLAPTS